MFKKVLKNKTSIVIFFISAVLISQLLNINPAHATGIVDDLLGAVGTVTGWAFKIVSAPMFTLLGVLVSGLAWVVGQISSIFTYMLFVVARYNGFITERLVVDGWIMVRDLCNMFFVLVLLVIAFATILRIESYNLKKTLPKLIIMAILINFSRTICGLIIDFAQVIMLTFVNAVDVPGSINGHGALVNALGLQNLFNMKEITNIFTSAIATTGATPFTTFGSMLFGFILLVIACIVIVVFTIILFIRTIMLWILIILSPIAYLASAIPATQKYASQWWDNFMKQVVVGPAMAFFLWLALSISSKAGDLHGFDFTKGSEKAAFTSAFLNTITGGTDGGMGGMFQYVVVILMLVAGMIMAQQAGGAAGSIAGKGIGWAKKGAYFGSGAAAGKAIGKAGIFAAGRKLDDAQMAVQRGAAKGLSKIGLVGKNYEAKSLNYKMIKAGWDRNKEDKKSKYEAGKAGTWQERFNRATTTQGGVLSKVPVVAAARRAKARKSIEEYSGELEKQEKAVETKEEEIKNLETERDKDGTTEERKIKIKEEINGKQEEIEGLKKDIRKNQNNIFEERKKLPENRQANIEKQRTISKYYSEIKEENHDEDGLIESFLREKNREKKRAYFQHLVDINGTNSLFATMGKKMDFKGINDFLEDNFKSDAGAVAADMGKRADAAGNSKLIGFASMNNRTGQVELHKDEKKQINIALTKDREKYDQNFARRVHFDSLVDQDENGNRNISKLGIKQLLNIAQSSGRTNEITKGNFQDRYGKEVVRLFKSGGLDKLRDVDSSLTDDEINAIKNVAKNFSDYYDPEGIAKRQKKEEKVASKEKEEKPYESPL